MITYSNWCGMSNLRCWNLPNDSGRGTQAFGALSPPRNLTAETKQTDIQTLRFSTMSN